MRPAGDTAEAASCFGTAYDLFDEAWVEEALLGATDSPRFEIAASGLSAERAKPELIEALERALSAAPRATTYAAIALVTTKALAPDDPKVVSVAGRVEPGLAVEVLGACAFHGAPVSACRAHVEPPLTSNDPSLARAAQRAFASAIRRAPEWKAVAHELYPRVEGPCVRAEMAFALDLPSDRALLARRGRGESEDEDFGALEDE
ncbi:MAG: hypothetical protein H5U40_16485 [Polyangiaceae bacterium]|nr:hypothetical protein [Polyangiaceae bacterium]